MQPSLPYDHIRATERDGDRIKLIDQRLLPERMEYIYLDGVQVNPVKLCWE